MPEKAQTPPILLLRQAAQAPLLLTCEHARSALPAGTGATNTERAVLRTHHGVDIGAWELTTHLARILGATAVGGRYSRLWIDLNRDTSEGDLIRPAAEGVDLRWNRGLTAQERTCRIRRFHHTYHRAVDRQVRRLVRSGIRPLLLSVHSFTGRWNGGVRGFDCGVLYDRDRRHARILAAGLRSQGFTVRYNEPYSGKQGLMYAIHRHGTAHRLPCLELEVNQRLLGSPGRIRRLAPGVAQAVAETMRR